MKRYRNSLLVALATGTLGLVFSACSSHPCPTDAAEGCGASDTGGTGGTGGGSGGSPAGGTGGGSGGANPTGGAPSGGEGGIGGFGGLGGMGGIGGAGACSCDDTEAWSLECYCAEFECPTLEEAMDDPFCPSSPGPLGEPEVVTGCGRITVTLPLAISGREYVYTEDDHELISASNFDDVGHGSCDTWAYAGGVQEVEACAVEDTEPLCP